ncbi:MAG: ribonuclease H family protein [Peptostreptococcales bacterium]
MAKQKYYAVRIGKENGIYRTWDECKKNVDGFSGAEYKSFSTQEEAEAFMSGQNMNLHGEDLSDKNIAHAYVDGSYSDSKNRYAYGAVLISPNGTIEEICGSDNNENALSSRNVAGELAGAMQAIQWAVKEGYKGIMIYHDYEGIQKWATGEWQAKSYVALKYLEFLQKYKKKLNIEFTKVLAHSGNKYNEMADALAKKGLEE